MKYFSNLVLLFLSALHLSATVVYAGPMVKMQTNQGTIVIELNSAKAPKTVENFLAYVQAGFYDNTIFHRVISDFMIQGGGFEVNFGRKSTREPVSNESNNGLNNERGTVAMARTRDPDSANSQFFINLKNNLFLDYSEVQGTGYTVFGKVVKGMGVVDKIGLSKTDRGGPFPKDVPQTPMIIEKMTVLAAAEEKAIPKSEPTEEVPSPPMESTKPTEDDEPSASATTRETIPTEQTAVETKPVKHK